MKITRMVGIAATVTVAAATATIVSATPASADAHGRCSDGWACLYENNDFNQDDGDNWRNFRKNKSDFRDYNWLRLGGGDSGDGMDNETSSIRNRTGHCVTLYQHVGYGGAISEFASGSSHDDGKLSDDHIDDNRASAIRMSC